MPEYRKPRNWICRIRIRRADEALDHQEAIEQIGFETYVETDLVMLSAFELGQQLHPGHHFVRGLVRVPVSSEGDLIARVKETD